MAWKRFGLRRLCAGQWDRQGTDQVWCWASPIACLGALRRMLHDGQEHIHAARWPGTHPTRPNMCTLRMSPPWYPHPHHAMPQAVPHAMPCHLVTCRLACIFFSALSCCGGVVCIMACFRWLHTLSCFLPSTSAWRPGLGAGHAPIKAHSKGRGSYQVCSDLTSDPQSQM